MHERHVCGGLARFACLLVAWSACSSAATLSSQDVLQHLNQTITWYQHVNSVQQPALDSQEMLLEDSVRESSRRAIQLAFSFAHAEAAALGQSANASSSNANTATPAGALQQAANNADQRVKNLESRIDALNQQIEHASGKKRATLVSQREALTAFLNLAKESQAAIQNMISFANSPGNGSASAGLTGEINELASSDSIPAALSTNPNANSRQSVSVQPFHPELAGLMNLLSDAVNLTRSRMHLNSAIAETNGLLAEIDKLRTPLRTALRTAIDQGNTLASAADTQNNPAQIQNVRQQLDQLASQFKNLTSVMTPLGEQALVVQSTRAGLQDWSNALHRQYNSTLRYLAVRAGVVVLAIFVLLVFSRLWRNAIERYVREPRRRKQFILVRRVVITLVIVLVVALGFFTTFGSVATFIGFLTAGLALALQNVILSVVAYFFLIGRYGIRVGDRVTISGVTGQVIEIGLVRFFLMELAGTGADLHPTGRVAVWANSMIFQPYSWLKQAPGAEYLWHAVSVILARETDCKDARSRLNGAVESVYESYRESIEQQHAAFEESISLQMNAPRPVSRIHFTETGCEIAIRYPVEMQHAVDVDDRVMRRILEELEKEPKLTLAEGGGPTIRLLA